MSSFKILNPSDTVKDFEDDLNIIVQQIIGAGFPPIQNVILPFGDTDGARFQQSLANPRLFTLICITKTTTRDAWQQARKDLGDLVKRDRQVDKKLPVKIRYTDGVTTIQIECHYNSGLEGSELLKITEKFPVSFLAVNPFWTDLSESSTALDVRDTATLDNFAHQDSSLVWSDLGLAAGGSNVTSIIYRQNGNIVVAIGGSGLVREYDGSWTTIGTFTGGNAAPQVVIEDADGNLIVGGNFTTVTGPVTVNNIASWDGAVWTEPDNGLDDTVFDLALDALTGDVYIAGVFTQDGTPAGTFRRIAKLSGGTITEIGGGLDATAEAVIVDNAGDVFVGGQFTQDGTPAGTLRRAAKLSGATWVEVGTGFNNHVTDLAVNSGNLLHIAGHYTADGPGSITYGGLTTFNGTSVIDLGAVLSGTVDKFIAIDPNNDNVVIGSDFTTIGGITTPSPVAIFDDQTYRAVPIDLPGVPAIKAVATDGDTLSIGYDTAGTAAFAGSVVINNVGTAELLPIFELSGPGDLLLIENGLTGKFFSFSGLTLFANETITIDLTTGVKTIISDTRGDTVNQFLDKVGDFGTFGILPANDSGPVDNPIKVFINDASASGTIKYTPRHWSFDGVT